MLKRTHLYLTLILLTTHCTYTYKTVMLISTPRSLSTVFLRMMEARGDFAIYNEPGMAALYNQKEKTCALDGIFHADVPTFAKVQNMLLEARQRENIFIKEMYGAAREYLFDDRFITSPDCHIIFIVRNPHHFALSHYKKLYSFVGTLEKYWGLKAEFPDFASYVSLYHLYMYAAEHAYHTPYVIIAEELVADPRRTITHLCKTIGLEMMEKCLSWETIDTQSSCQELWHDSKSIDGIYLWHDRAMSSTSFGQLPTYKVDAQGNPTFEEIEDRELRAAYRWEYYHNRMYYNKFVAIAHQQQ